MTATIETSEILKEIISTINKNARTCENILGRDKYDLSRSFSFVDVDKIFTTAKDPAIEEPETEEPAIDEPTVEEPAIDEPTVEEPAIDEPTVEEPAIDEPTIEVSAIDKATPGFDKESLKPKLEALIAEGYSFRDVWNGLLVLADEKKI